MDDDKNNDYIASRNFTRKNSSAQSCMFSQSKPS